MSAAGSPDAHAPISQSVSGRLDSWKEIATYLKRSVRTVRRWESEQQLPVHRHFHHSAQTVYAFKNELDAWWANYQPELQDRSGANKALHVGRTRVRKLAWPAVAAIVLIAVSVFAYRVLHRPISPSGKLMLAVLPFDNLSAEAEHEYLSDGLTEELITDLGRLNPARLGVIARNSIMLYKGKRVAIRDVGSKLGVQYVLEGSVRKAGSRVRVSAQLIRTSDETHLWAKNYERNLEDILGLQAEVSQAIANEIQVELTPEEHARVAGSGRVNPEAYDAYIRGRYYWNLRTPEGLQEALQLFQTAASLAPDYAPAYTGISDSYNVLAGQNLADPASVYPKAYQAALKAMQLHDSLAEPHASLASILASYHWDFPAAEREFRRAIELNPSYATAHQWYSELLVGQGRFPEALAEISDAQRLDPLSGIISGRVVMTYLFAHQPEQAVAAGRRTVELYPSFPYGRWALGLAYVHRGMYEDAITELKKGAALSARAPHIISVLAYVYAVTGRHAEAQELRRELQQRSSTGYVAAFHIALVYLGLGDKDKAFEFLTKAVENHQEPFPAAFHDALLDPLRSDPRWTELEKKARAFER